MSPIRAYLMLILAAVAAVAGGAYGAYMNDKELMMVALITGLAGIGACMGYVSHVGIVPRRSRVSLARIHANRMRGVSHSQRGHGVYLALAAVALWAYIVGSILGGVNAYIAGFLQAIGG